MSAGNGDSKGSVFGQVLRHPLQTLKLVNRSNIKLFFDAVHHSGFRAALSTTSRVMNNYSNDVNRVNSISEYTRHLDDVPDHLELPYFEEPLVSIVIPVYNQYRFTMACIDSIIRNTPDVAYEVILGDDRSSDETVDIAEHVRNLVVVRNDTNLGFTLNCNHAAEKARGKYLHFLNNDTLVCEGWLSSLVRTMESSERVGAVGSKLVYPDGLLQEAGGIIWSDGTALNYGKGGKPNEPQYNYVKEVDYITGASLMVRRDLFEKAGGFDPIYAPAYCEDSDLCLSVRSIGYSVLYQPLSMVIHFEGMTHGKAAATRINPHQQVNVGKLRDKWQDYLKANCNSPGTDVFHARDRSVGRKTVLLVTDHLPTSDLDSGSRVVFLYLKCLSDMGYNVKLASADYNYDPCYAVPLQQMGVEIFFGTPDMEDWKELAKKFRRDFDHILLCGYDCAARFGKYLDRHMKARTHYLCLGDPQLALEREYDITHDSHVLMDLALYKRHIEAVLKHTDSVITVGGSEGRTEYGSVDVSDMPYAVSPIKIDRDPEGKMMLFTGFMGSRCNQDAVRWFISDILPKVLERVPDAEFRIVGGMIPEDMCRFTSEYVVFDGHLDDSEIKKLYSECSVFVDPVRFSSGTRGNLLDAMGCAIPVVGTVAAFEGMTGLELAGHNDPQGFAEELVRILEDNGHADSVGKIGSEFVSRMYSSQELENTLRNLLD